MAIDSIQIPMFDLPRFTEELTIDGIMYTLGFDWNFRASYWSMSISDRAGNLILAGIRLVIGFPLFNKYLSYPVPKGSLEVFDPNPITQDIEPGRKDFTSGRNLMLLYYPIGV